MAFTVLIVDDEEEVARTLAHDLQGAGYETIYALNGRDAFTLLCGGGVDLILSDVRMPDGDGIELLARIRLKGLTQPFAFVSAFADVTRQRALNLGAQALFAKPYEAADVLAFVNGALQGLRPWTDKITTTRGRGAT